MEFFRIRKSIPFMRHALVFNIVSLVVFVLAVVFLVVRGLNFSIEFTGGTVMEVSYAEDANPDKIRDALAGIGLKDVSVQSFGTSKDILIRLPLKVVEGKSQNVEMQKQSDAVMGALKGADSSANLKRVEFVGGQVGKELATDGGLALLWVCIGIVIYLAFRFEWRFAVATIIANLHDVVIILGFFAFFQWEFSLPVLAAVLAVFGYSVNESVVVFDRVRENFRSMRAEPREIMNLAINQTLSRTIITSFVAFLSMLALYMFGGESLRGLAEAQIIGVVIGTLSSIFVACPLLLWMNVTKQDLMPKAKDEAALARRP